MNNYLQFLDRLSTLYRNRGAIQYGGEAVTQLEHALQAATLAESEGASPSWIIAALLHDVGHLLEIGSTDIDKPLYNARHENLAVPFLSSCFGDDVIDPIHYHVAAKRYLCTTDPDYLAILSPVSVSSLHVQGGIMSPTEVLAFQSLVRFDAILAVRRWDDAAKIPGYTTPPFEYFHPYLEACFVSRP